MVYWAKMGQRSITNLVLESKVAYSHKHKLSNDVMASLSRNENVRVKNLV